MPSNMPPGYSDDGDAISHGSESAMYQEFLPIKAAFDKWYATNRKELWSPEMEADADVMETIFESLAAQMNTPL